MGAIVPIVAYRLCFVQDIPTGQLTVDNQYHIVLFRDEDPDLVGSADISTAGSGTFYIGSGSYLYQRIYKINFILNRI